jgi:hypothetical protein
MSRAEFTIAYDGPALRDIYQAMVTPKRGGRTRVEASGKVQPSLTPNAIACLEYVAKTGRYGGSTKTAVAGYLIMREIDDLTRTGVLPTLLTE